MLLALDLGGTKLAWALLDRHGSIETSGQIRSNEIAPHSLPMLLAQEIPTKSVEGVGVAIAAACQGPRVTYSPNLPHFEGVDMQAMFRDWNVPVNVVYDGHAALLGELWATQHERALQSALMLVIGTGIGGALMVNGGIWRGAHGLAGVAGIVPSRDGRALEYWAAGPGVARMAQSANGHQALARYHSGDPVAIAAFKQASDALYQSISGITALLDIQDVLIGGGFGWAAFHQLFPEADLPHPYIIHPVTQRGVRIMKAFSSQVNLFGSVVQWLEPRTTSRQS